MAFQNPLLHHWWKSQFKLSLIYRSQVILMGVPLLLLIALTYAEHRADQFFNYETGRELRRILYDVRVFYALLFIPIATLLPSLTLIALFRRWDRQSRFEPQLIPPFSRWQWFIFFIISSAVCPAIFLVGWWSCVFVFSLHPTIWDVLTGDEICFYLSAPYVVLQSLWSATVSLHFLSRNRSIGLACVKALSILLGVGLLSIPIDWTNDWIHWLSVVNGAKIPIVIALLAILPWSLRDRLIRRLSP